METILLVDDDAMVLTLCQRILHLGGYSVIAAGSGLEALRLMKSSTEKIDLALLDVMMPGMNGIRTGAAVSKRKSGHASGVMTGYGPNEIARVVNDNNPYRIIWKPFKQRSRCCA